MPANLSAVKLFLVVAMPKTARTRSPEPAASHRPDELPLLSAAPSERADASRNRQRVLAAARRLFDQRGPENVSIDEIAREAGVAKGTVFHRFGDRSGLALALLDEHERELHERILGGPPPLGPGAPPIHRLVAFCDALLDLLEAHGALLYDSETAKAGARYRTGAYSAWHQHVAHLISQTNPEANADLLADLLLAPFAAELHHHLRTERGRDAPELREAVADLVTRVLR